MYSKKKQPKVMINGWRSAHAGEMKMLELSELDKFGDDFVKAELMDAVIKLGMAAYKNGEVFTIGDMIKEHEEVKPEKPAKTKRFAKPDLIEVGRYMVERGLSNSSASAESQGFFDHYESNGWKVGKNPMKCWKAAVRNWTKGKSFNAPSNQQPANQYNKYNPAPNQPKAIEGELL